MKKNKMILILGLVLIIALVAVKSFIKLNEKFDGAVISGGIGGISIGNNKEFSKEEEEFLRNICSSKRKHGTDINSEEAKKLGEPTNDMMMSIFYNTDLLSTKTHHYNLWIGSKAGYIQNKEDSKIYKLSSDENKFFIDSYLKFHSEEEVKSMISKEY